MLSKVQIKTIHALQHKKYRQKYSLFIAEGLKITQELLHSENIEVESLFITPDYIEKISPKDLKQTQIYEITERELKKITLLNSPQAALVLAKIPKQPNILSLKGKKTLLLEAIRNPGNLGTIIRISDWFGIEQIICSPDCVDVYNPKTVQATMGSIARVKVTYMNLTEVLKNHKDITSFATTLTGKPITEISGVREGLIIIGNESKGVSKALLQQVDECITIPRIGQAESLNVAVATGIVCGQLFL